MNKLSKKIRKWIEIQPNWFQYWQMDEALHITNEKDKTCRRVLLKRLSERGIVSKHPSKVHGVFRYNKPLKRIEWQ